GERESLAAQQSAERCAVLHRAVHTGHFGSILSQVSRGRSKCLMQGPRRPGPRRIPTPCSAAARSTSSSHRRWLAPKRDAFGYDRTGNFAMKILNSGLADGINATTQFAALVDSVVGSGLSVRFRAAGDSMSPTILNGDIITVAPVVL